MILAVSKRWHLWRHHVARWLLARVVDPASTWLYDVVKSSAALANDQHDKARLRLEICKRCPVFDAGWCRRDRGGCGCKMPVKVQIPEATCPQGRW